MPEEIDFFIITSLDTEAQALDELQLLMKSMPTLNLHTLVMTEGGIEGKGELKSILSLNYYLKIPTRILLRLAPPIKMRDFPKIFQWIKKFNWPLWVGHPHPTWKVSAKTSRLIHTGRIEETCEAAYKAYLKAKPLKETWLKNNWGVPEIYIRLVDDEMTVSLDTTGLPLYKRGYQNVKGEAPIRENLAHWLLSILFQGINDPIEVMDPLCGSGTFLTEALFWDEPNLQRDFSFEQSPLGKYADKKTVLKIQPPSIQIKKLRGYDLNQDLITKLKQQPMLEPIDWDVHDVLQSPKKIESTSPLFIITNPPYGERLEIENIEVFFRTLWAQILKYNPSRCVMIIPRELKRIFKDVQFIDFKNGGIPVSALIYNKPGFEPKLQIRKVK